MPAVSAKNIAFVYADDLWVADLDGKNPRQLTTDLGLESHPVFSPDGQTIAFSAQYDGNTDVYTIPLAGGTPTRLTSHPAPDIVRGFTPGRQERALLLEPARLQRTATTQLFTVPLTGGMPKQLPIPWGFEAAYSPDGEYIAYTPVRDATVAVEALSRRHALAHLGLQRQDARRGRDPAAEGPLQRSRPELDRQHALLPLRSHRRVQRVLLRHRHEGSEAGHAVHRLPGPRHQHRRQEADLRAGRLSAPARTRTNRSRCG